MKNILVAIDFSNATDAVIHQIGKLACPNDSIIHLLHIVEPSICYEVSGVLPDEVPVPVMDQTEENEVISIAKNHLQKTAEKLSRLTDATIIQAVEDEFEISQLRHAEIPRARAGGSRHQGRAVKTAIRTSPVPLHDYHTLYRRCGRRTWPHRREAHAAGTQKGAWGGLCHRQR